MGRLIGDVAAIARWADAPTVNLAGHDFGSAVTWGACTFAPQLVRRAVTMAGPHPLRMKSVAGDLRQIMKAAYTFLMNMGPGSEGEALLSADNFGMLERFAFGDHPAISAEDRAAYRQEWSQPGAFTAMAEWYRAHYSPSLLNPDIPLELPKTEVPIRYIHGTKDFAFVEKLAETNEPFVAGPYDHVLIDSSHWMLHERPDEIAELIVDWLTRT
jgi:pimeloyl-ACP methyl ester carboxylesterase